jgi:hypothetical protein
MKCYTTEKVNGVLVFEGYEECIPDQTLLDKILSLTKATANWVKEGAPITDEETLKVRLETCKGCEFWDESGFDKTGRCKKCGCSTQAKLRMATEKCPIGKW